MRMIKQMTRMMKKMKVMIVRVNYKIVFQINQWMMKMMIQKIHKRKWMKTKKI